MLYIEDDGLLTSAGTVAGIDCCLHLVRQRLGAQTTNHLARRLVVAPHRQGGQAQFIEQPLPDSAQDGRLGELLVWLRQNLDQAHSLDSLAQRVLMSRRTFTRHFRQLTGTTVNQWLQAERLALAQRLLETTEHSGAGDRRAGRLRFGGVVAPAVLRRVRPAAAGLPARLRLPVRQRALLQLLAPERVHRPQLHRAEQRLRRAGVPGPELVAEIVVPPFAGQVAETGVEHRVIEQATMIADASLARVGLRQAFEVGGVEAGTASSKALPMSSQRPWASHRVTSTAPPVRCGWAPAAAARRRDELAGEPFQLGFAGPWVVRGRAGQAVVEILLHGERPPGVQHHQAHAAGEGGGDPQETLEDLAASVTPGIA